MKVKVQLSGGLGNQLFQYFEGASRALDNKSTLELDFRNVYLGKTKHYSYLTSFTLPVNACLVNQDPKRAAIFLGKARLFCKHRAIFYSKNRNQLATSPANEVQSNLFFQKVIQEYPQWIPKLTNPSRWFTEMRALLENEDFIAVHVRRGDYAKERNIYSIGMLSPSYYVDAIGLLERNLGTLPILVFSDSDLVNDEMQKLFPIRTQFVNPPEKSDPAESMMLMAYARGLVISNSTFSWWAARFAQGDSMIIAPKPWFKCLPEPKNLIPSNWILVQGQWIVPNERE